MTDLALLIRFLCLSAVEGAGLAIAVELGSGPGTVLALLIGLFLYLDGKYDWSGL